MTFGRLFVKQNTGHTPHKRLHGEQNTTTPKLSSKTFPSQIFQLDESHRSKKLSFAHTHSAHKPVGIMKLPVYDAIPARKVLGCRWNKGFVLWVHCGAKHFIHWAVAAAKHSVPTADWLHKLLRSQISPCINSCPPGSQCTDPVVPAPPVEHTSASPNSPPFPRVRPQPPRRCALRHFASLLHSKLRRREHPRTMLSICHLHKPRGARFFARDSKANAH